MQILFDIDEVFDLDFPPLHDRDPDELVAEEFLMSNIKKRGFGSMDKDRQREIASKGGKSVPADKRSFSQNRLLASLAGRKGGMANADAAHVR